MKKRTEIMIETDRVLVIRSRDSAVIWCESCARKVRMVTVDEAAAMTHSSARTIFRLAEAGKYHFTETPDGKLLICSASL